MIEAFTKAWFANIESVREKLVAKHPESYKAIVRIVVEMLAAAIDEYDAPRSCAHLSD